MKIKSNVINTGEHIKQEYPVIKQWQHYNTFALFSKENDAVIISSDEAHEHDYVGKKVEDVYSLEWVVVKGFEIIIKG